MSDIYLYKDDEAGEVEVYYNTELNSVIVCIGGVVKHQSIDSIKIKRQNNLYRKALEFYADEDTTYIADMVINKDYSMNGQCKARAALKKAKDLTDD